MTVSTMTHDQLLDAIETELNNRLPSNASTSLGLKCVDELRHRMSPGAYWPQKTFETAQAIFGGPVLNTGSRTYQALDRRIRHALRVWDAKYGPLNAKQEQYADEVLAGCLRTAQRDAEGNKTKLWPFAQAAIGRAIVHERVHAGMKSRIESVDVTDLLKGVAA